MMEASVISAKLDLLVRLIDTTTGAQVTERNIVFKRDGTPVRPEPKDPGVYIFINTGREDFLMRIEVFGYEIYEERVRYEELDDRLPECDVFLMPSESMSRGEKVLSFSGTLPFLKKIEAVCLDRPVCYAKEINRKTNELTVYTAGGGRVSLNDRYYGLLNADKTSYEKIEVEAGTSLQSVRLKEPVREEQISNLAVARVIFGRVSGNGDYLIRVRNSGTGIKHLIRYEAGEEVRFRVIDFESQEEKLI
ncbi:MAG: hypothetical protein IJT24_07805 [Lachnospiraceae bacterium]|nr:hypothetical protein [Lachnospiraceae bacterium]